MADSAVQGVQGASLKGLNAQSVLRSLLDVGPSTTPELAARLGLSKPTVATALRRLGDADLVTNLGIRSGALGRSPALWGIKANAGLVVGMDLGTRVVQAALADLDGRMVAHHVEPLEGTDASAIAATVERGLAALLSEDGEDAAIASVVVGVPGAVDPVSGQVRLAANMPGLHEPEALGALRDRFAGRVELVKDIHLAAHAELRARDGAGADFALITVGRGVGAAIVRGGQLVSGSRGFAGEIGYLGLGPYDEVAGHAPLEEAASSQRILRDATAHGLNVHDVAGFAEAVERGDRHAVELLEREVALVAHAASALSIASDPGMFVLTGSIPLAFGHRFADLVHARLQRVLPLAAAPVEIAMAGPGATVSGAIAFAVSRSWEAIIDGLRD